MEFSRTIMIIGASRSGTSWVGKVFDSHPDVLYRHEPDASLHEPGLPFLIDPAETERYVPLAAEYAQRLLLTHTVKSAGHIPVFPKSYYSKAAGLAHGSLIHALKWAEKLSGRNLSALSIPDLFQLNAAPTLRPVVKSVSARGRAGAFIKAMPGARFVFLLRHPCGQIASALRGGRTGKMQINPFIETTLATPHARRAGLRHADLAAMTLPGQLAWQWVSLNELAFDAFQGHQNARVAVYEDLCADPVNYARDLFAFSDLSWNPQTEDFIRRSTSYAGAERYYSVFRNPVTAVGKWRTELPEEDQRIILDIVRQSRFAAFWPDIGATAPATVSA